jgi:hypothetical protein
MAQRKWLRLMAQLKISKAKAQWRNVIGVKGLMASEIIAGEISIMWHGGGVAKIARIEMAHGLALKLKAAAKIKKPA